MVLVRVSRYFSSMGIERLSAEEAKDFWFQGDLTIYTLGSEWSDEVIALPKIEVERGLVYLRKLKSCRTYEEAQNLHIEFCKDPEAPKLIPRIIDPMDDLEFIEDLFWNYLLTIKGIKPEEQLDYVDQELGLRDFMNEFYNGDWLPHEYDDAFRELQEHIVLTEVPFLWNEAPPYLDDNGIFAACRDMQRWTDAWIPEEIAQTLGTPDLGFGIDYYAAESLYMNLDSFIDAFGKHGIKTELSHPDLQELVGLDFTQTAPEN